MYTPYEPTMTMNPLKPFEIKPAVLEQVLSLGATKHYDRGHLFFDTMLAVNPLLYIRKGVVRNFYRLDDLEMTNCISVEGEFACTDSFFSGVSGNTFLKAVDAIEVIEIKRDVLHEAYRDYPFLERFGRLLAESHLRVMERNCLIISTKSALERYQLFLKWYPHLNGRIPLKYVASLLNLDQATLSRVRGKKLATG